MASQNTAATVHTFQAHDEDTLVSEVASVRCILLPGSLTVAGYNSEGLVLMVRHTDAPGGEWEPHFFEHQFLNEPLLALPQQTRALFIGSPYQLIVPDALYDAAESGRWLRSLYHLHPEDSVLASVAKGEEAHYLISLPVKMQALLHKYFPEADVLPLAAYQLMKPATDTPLLRCLIGSREVMATLYNKGKLTWHQVFTYDEVTDIAWKFASLCREYHIALMDLQLEATALCDGCYDQILELETFLPKIQWSGNDLGGQVYWSPVISLLQQLYTCAL
jgi:hypothetical protein